MRILPFIAKERILVIMMLFMMSVLAILGGASNASAQERIDDWYGKEMTQLHADLQHDYDRYGSPFEYKNHGNDRVSLTMTDYRNVECEYISLDGGYTVTYRVDHYTKKEYTSRIEFIKRKWEKREDAYVLQNQVVAMFDDKKHRIAFAKVEDLKNSLGGPFTHKFQSKL
jgi:hypothetical protein